jgi:hypothetical protein
MLDWSYRLSDFLLFSPRVYWRMFELHNEALWPLQMPILAIGLAAVVLALLRPGHHGRVIAILLAALWVSVGWNFMWQRYSAINWAALYIAPFFGLQALLLLVSGLLSGLRFDQSGVRRVAGYALFSFAFVGYPLLAPLSGRPWSGAEILGIAPDPTAIGTLGLLMLARGRMAVLLAPMPILWCLISGATLWAMAAWEAWIPVIAAGLVALTALRRRVPDERAQHGR